MQPSFAALGPALNVLLVWPRFPQSFWGFEGILEMVQEEANVPPLGLITVAALCPPSWTLRLLDHAFDEITDEDYKWADLVMVSACGHGSRIERAPDFQVRCVRRLEARRNLCFATGKAFRKDRRYPGADLQREVGYTENAKVYAGCCALSQCP